MPKFNPHNNFNFQNHSEWPEWKNWFARFRLASKLNKEENQVQISSLIYAMGQMAEKIFSSLTFDSPDDKDKYDVNCFGEKK